MDEWIAQSKRNAVKKRNYDKRLEKDKSNGSEIRVISSSKSFNDEKSNGTSVEAVIKAYTLSRQTKINEERTTPSLSKSIINIKESSKIGDKVKIASKEHFLLPNTEHVQKSDHENRRHTEGKKDRGGGNITKTVQWQEDKTFDCFSTSCLFVEKKAKSVEEKADSPHCKTNEGNNGKIMMLDTARAPGKKRCISDKGKGCKIVLTENIKKIKNIRSPSFLSGDDEEYKGKSLSKEKAGSPHCTTMKYNKGKIMLDTPLIPKKEICISDKEKGSKIEVPNGKRKNNTYSSSLLSPYCDGEDGKRSSSGEEPDSMPCTSKKRKYNDCIFTAKRDMKCLPSKPSDRQLASQKRIYQDPRENSNGTVCMIPPTEYPVSSKNFTERKHTDKEPPSSFNREEADVKRYVKGKLGTYNVSRQTKCSSHKYKKPLDDTLTESVVTNLAEDMKSVGVIIAYGSPVGTVFCVGKKYVITANHVIEGISENDLFNSKKTFVNFNESPVTQGEEVFTFKQLVFKNQKLDVAVLEVSNPKHLPKGITLSKLNHDEISNVSVIGYGHPNHAKKTLDPCCTLVSSSRKALTENWLEAKKFYHRGALRATDSSPDIADIGLGNLNSYNFFIDNFMEQGVSGAPALKAERDGRTKVTGIVTHGTPELYYLLPKIMRSPMYPPEHVFTVGTTMEAIYVYARSEDQKLAEALFSEG